MRGEPHAETHFIRRFRRERQVEQPGLAADPARVPPRALEAWCAMKWSSISPGVMRRVDGIGGLADAVGHPHRPDLQG